MPSFGEQDISADSQIIGKFRIIGLTAASALQPRILLAAECVLRSLEARPDQHMPAVEGYALLELTGEVLLGGPTGPTVTDVRWLDKDRRVEAVKFESPTQVTLVGDLDFRRLELLERMRDGNAPVLWLRLFPTLIRSAGPLQGRIQPMQLDIPRERWLEFLSASKFGDSVVVEVPVPRGLAQDVREAVEHLREAQRHLTEGGYDQVALSCRKVMDVVREDASDDSSHNRLLQILAGAVGDDRAKSYIGIVRTLKQLTAPAAHAFGRRNPYTRGEALFLIRCTTAFLSLLGELPLDQIQLSALPKNG